MKLISICLVAVGTLFCMEGKTQVSFKTEYIGSSAYMYLKDDEKAVRVGDNNGSAVVYQGMANIPVFMEKNENDRPTAWGVGLGGAYALLNNKKFTGDMVSEIMNLQLGFFHISPLNDRWSMMASIGAGIYAPFTKFSKIRYKNILGNVGVVFIRHINANLDLGGGLAVNSSLGYPMAFPALYLNWNYESKFEVNVSLGEGLELTAGCRFNDYFSLSLAAEMSGQMALLEKDGKDMIFTHQYIVAGVRPEIKLGKSGFSIPVTMGINAVRPAYYSNRTLKGMFASNNTYFFRISPYASAGIKFGF